MTDVFLSHNPFTMKTEITINAEPVGSTSKLYRYLSTPMQDWVDSFLPTLVEHCNDDEIAVTFKGLQYNYDDLSTALQAFLKANRDYDIKLLYDASRSQLARLGAIRSLVDELQTQTVVEELKQADFCSVMGTEAEDLFEVHLLSGNDGLKAAFLKDLLGVDAGEASSEKGCRYIDCDSQAEFVQTASGELFDTYSGNIPFSSAKFMRLAINDLPNTETQSNAYYRFTKKAIEDEKKPVVIYLLDQDSDSNNPEYLNLIAQKFLLRGKQNKNRFIFVAENPLWAKKMLNSEYAMKNATVYATDDIEKINHSIAEYMNENCLVEKIAAQVLTFNEKFGVLQTQLFETANKRKNTDKINDAYQAAITEVELLFSTIGDSIDVKPDSVEYLEKRVCNFYQEIVEKYKGCGDKRSEEEMYIFLSGLRENFQSFLEDCSQAITPQPFLQYPSCENSIVQDVNMAIQKTIDTINTTDTILYKTYVDSAFQKIDTLHFCTEPDIKYDDLHGLEELEDLFSFSVRINRTGLELSWKLGKKQFEEDYGAKLLDDFMNIEKGYKVELRDDHISTGASRQICYQINDYFLGVTNLMGIMAGAWAWKDPAYRAATLKLLMECLSQSKDIIVDMLTSVQNEYQSRISKMKKTIENEKEIIKKQFMLAKEVELREAQISAQDQARLDYITALADKVQALIAL